MSSFTNRARASQLVDFDGLQWGKCRCTDIDISFDWQGKLFGFVEIKTGDAPLTLGQKIHLTSLVDAIEAGGRKAVAIVASHNTPLSSDVMASDCTVRQVYTGGKWEKFTDSLETLSEYLDSIYVQQPAQRLVK